MAQQLAIIINILWNNDCQFEINSVSSHFVLLMQGNDFCDWKKKFLKVDVIVCKSNPRKWNLSIQLEKDLWTIIYDSVIDYPPPKLTVINI